MAIQTKATGKAKPTNQNTTMRSSRSSISSNRINIKIPMRIDRDANNRMDQP